MHTQMDAREVDSGEALSRGLEEAFKAFEELQALFFDAVRERPQRVLDQLPQWDERRQRGCARLQELLGSLQDGLDAGDGRLEEGVKWQRRLAAVLKAEEGIHAALTELKGTLTAEMRTLRRGRDALLGYHSGIPGKRPLYVSQDA